MLSYNSGSLLWFSWLWVTSFVCMSSIWSPFDVSSGNNVAWLLLVGQFLPARLRFASRYAALITAIRCDTEESFLTSFERCLLVNCSSWLEYAPIGRFALRLAQLHLIEKKVHHSRFSFFHSLPARICALLLLLLPKFSPCTFDFLQKNCHVA